MEERVFLPSRIAGLGGILAFRGRDKTASLPDGQQSHTNNIAKTQNQKLPRGLWDGVPEVEQTSSSILYILN